MSFWSCNTSNGTQEQLFIPVRKVERVAWTECKLLWTVAGGGLQRQLLKEDPSPLCSKA
jgi:hypothetical protein